MNFKNKNITEQTISKEKIKNAPKSTFNQKPKVSSPIDNQAPVTDTKIEEVIGHKKVLENFDGVFGKNYVPSSPEDVNQRAARLFLSQPEVKTCYSQFKEQADKLFVLAGFSGLLARNLPVLRMLSEMPWSGAAVIYRSLNPRAAALNGLQLYLDAMDPNVIASLQRILRSPGFAVRAAMRQITNSYQRFLRGENIWRTLIKGGGAIGRAGIVALSLSMIYVMSNLIAGRQPLNDPRKTIKKNEKIDGWDVAWEFSKRSIEVTAMAATVPQQFAVEISSQDVKDECKDSLVLATIIAGAIGGAGISRGVGAAFRSIRGLSYIKPTETIGSILGQLTAAYDDVMKLANQGKFGMLGDAELKALSELHESFKAGNIEEVFNWRGRVTAADQAFAGNFDKASEVFEKYKSYIYYSHKQVLETNEALLVSGLKGSRMGEETLKKLVDNIDEGLLDIQALSAKDLGKKALRTRIALDPEFIKLQKTVAEVNNDWVKLVQAMEVNYLKASQLTRFTLADESAQMILTKYGELSQKINDVVIKSYKNAGITDDVVKSLAPNGGKGDTLIKQLLRISPQMFNQADNLGDFKAVIQTAAGEKVISRAEAVRILREQSKYNVLSELEDFIIGANAGGTAEDISKLIRIHQDGSIKILDNIIKNPSKVSLSELIGASAIARMFPRTSFHVPVGAAIGAGVISLAGAAATGYAIYQTVKPKRSTLIQNYLNKRIATGDKSKGEIFDDPEQSKYFFYVLKEVFLQDSDKERKDRIFGILNFTLYEPIGVTIDSKTGSEKAAYWKWSKLTKDIRNEDKDVNPKQAARKYYNRFLEESGIIDNNEKLQNKIRGFLSNNAFVDGKDDIDKAAKNRANILMIEFFIRNSNLLGRIETYFEKIHKRNDIDARQKQSVLEDRIFVATRVDVENVEKKIKQITKIQRLDQLNEGNIMNRSDLVRLVSEVLNENSGQGYGKYPYETNYHSEEEPDDDYQVEWKSLVDEVCGPKKKNVDGDPNTYEDAAVEVAKIFVKEPDLFREVLELSGVNKSVGTEIMNQLKKAKEKKLVDKELKT